MNVSKGILWIVVLGAIGFAFTVFFFVFLFGGTKIIATAHLAEGCTIRITETVMPSKRNSDFFFQVDWGDDRDIPPIKIAERLNSDQRPISFLIVNSPETDFVAAFQVPRSVATSPDQKGQESWQRLIADKSIRIVFDPKSNKTNVASDIRNGDAFLMTRFLGENSSVPLPSKLADMLKTITDVAAYNDEADASFIDSLQEFPQLESLSLGDMHLSENVLSRIVALNSLTTLRLQNVSLDSQAQKTLFDLRQLRQLILTNTPLDFDIQEALVENLPQAQIIIRSD